MKVLYIHNSYKWGGADRSLYELVTSLSAINAENYKPFFICQTGETADIYESDGFNIIRVAGLSQFDNTNHGYYRYWRWGILLREFIYLPHTIITIVAAKIKWGKMDIVHLNEYTLLLPSIIAKIIFKTPVIVHCRSLQRSPSLSMRALLIEKIYNAIDATVVAIDIQVSSILPDIKKKAVIHNSYNKKSSLNEKTELSIPKTNSNYFKIGFVGAISLVKGIVELLEAIALCKSKGLKVKLYIAGDPERKRKKSNMFIKAIHKKVKGSYDILFEINNMVDNKGIRECVNFTGFVDNLDLFYRNIDLLCFPSRLNAVGRPVFEAGFYGKPSIVAINQSWQDTVVDGVSGIIVSENNPEEIAMAIEELYRNKNILKKMGEKAREIARRYYEPTKNAKLMYCLYQNIIKGK